MLLQEGHCQGLVGLAVGVRRRSRLGRQRSWRSPVLLANVNVRPLHAFNLN